MAKGPFDFAVRLWQTQKQAREEDRNSRVASGGYEGAVEHTGAGVETTLTDRAGRVARMVEFLPSHERPEGYPPALPFLPEVPATVQLHGGDWKAVSWFPLDDPDALLGRVSEQLQGEGWTARGEPRNRFWAGLTQELRKGPDKITLRISKGRKLSLIRKSEATA